jgi:hypothetical protein
MAIEAAAIAVPSQTSGSGAVRMPRSVPVTNTAGAPTARIATTGASARSVAWKVADSGVFCLAGGSFCYQVNLTDCSFCNPEKISLVSSAFSLDWPGVRF